jgi:hypothetical protein
MRIKTEETHQFGRLSTGYTLLFASLVIFSQIGWWGLFFFIPGFPLAFARKSTLIQKHKQRLFHGYSLLGVKFGQWTDISRHPELVLLKSDKAWRSKYNTRESCSTSYEIILVSRSHLSKIYVAGFPDADEARAKAAELAVYLERPLVKFSPVRISRRR